MSHINDIYVLICNELKAAIVSYAPEVKIYHGAPLEALKPYIEINSMDSINDDIVNLQKYRHMLRLNIWSIHQGNQQVAEIMELLRGRVHEKRYELPSGRINRVSVKHIMARRDLDNVTYMGNMMIEIHSQF